MVAAGSGPDLLPFVERPVVSIPTEPAPSDDDTAGDAADGWPGDDAWDVAVDDFNPAQPAADLLGAASDEVDAVVDWSQPAWMDPGDLAPESDPEPDFDESEVEFETAEAAVRSGRRPLLATTAALTLVLGSAACWSLMNPDPSRVGPLALGRTPDARPSITTPGRASSEPAPMLTPAPVPASDPGPALPTEAPPPRVRPAAPSVAVAAAPPVAEVAAPTRPSSRRTVPEPESESKVEAAPEPSTETAPKPVAAQLAQVPAFAPRPLSTPKTAVNAERNDPVIPPLEGPVAPRIITSTRWPGPEDDIKPAAPVDASPARSVPADEADLAPVEPPADQVAGHATRAAAGASGGKTEAAPDSTPTVQAPARPEPPPSGDDLTVVPLPEADAAPKRDAAPPPTAPADADLLPAATRPGPFALAARPAAPAQPVPYPAPAAPLLPSPAAALKESGLAHLLAGRLPEALADFDDALRLDPRDAATLKNRGALHWQAKRYPEALADFDQALAIDPNDAVAYNNRGLVHRSAGDYPRALADYDEALRRDPSNHVFVYNRAQALALSGRDAEAIATLDRAIRLDPDYARAYRARGEAHARRGDRVRADADLARARQLGLAAAPR